LTDVKQKCKGCFFLIWRGSRRWRVDWERTTRVKA
jgi:hypothetical protein